MVVVFLNCCGWSCRLFVVSKDAFGSAVTVEVEMLACLRIYLDENMRIWEMKAAAKQKVFESSQLLLLLTRKWQLKV
jgi:hypothetical protein